MEDLQPPKINPNVPIIEYAVKPKVNNNSAKSKKPSGHIGFFTCMKTIKNTPKYQKMQISVYKKTGFPQKWKACCVFGILFFIKIL